MDNDRRTGSPVLKRKLDRPTSGGPPIGRMITLGAVGSIALGLVGVVVAASLPSVDLFGIYAKRQNATAAATTPEKTNVPSKAPPAPAPLPITRAEGDDNEERPVRPRPHANPDESEDDDLDNSPDDDPNNIDEGKTPGPNGSDATTPATVDGDRSIDRDMIYLKDLHSAVELPALNDVGETTLSYLQDAAKLAYSDVALMSDVAVLGARQKFKFDRDGTSTSWTISLIDPELSGGKVEIAKIWCIQSSVMFHWLPDAVDAPIAEQLRNTAVRFTIGSSIKYMALRKPLPQPVHTIDLSDRTNEIAAKIENPPKPDSIYIEVIGAKQLPINAHYENELAIVPVKIVEKPDPATKKGPKSAPKAQANTTPKDAEAAPSRVTILFDNLNDGEQPQLWIDASQSAPGELEIEIAAKIIRGKIINDLTKKSLELYRVPRDEQVARVERDWKNAHDRIVTIDRKIGDIRQGAGDGTPIKTLQARQLQAQREYDRYDKDIKRIKAELAWVDAANTMIQSLDGHGQVKYRVFAKSGDFELGLVRGGLD